jgi:hypothetical protein
MTRANYVTHSSQRLQAAGIMTARIMEKVEQKGISEQLHSAAWNVRGINNKEEELENELQK